MGAVVRVRTSMGGPQPGSRLSPSGRAVVLSLALLLLLPASLLLPAAAASGQPAPTGAPGAPGAPGFRNSASPQADSARGPLLTEAPLALSVSASTSSVCAFGLSTCSAAPPTVRVNLTVAAPDRPAANSTPVEILYLLDISIFTACDLDVVGTCPAGWSPIAPAFLASAGAVASTLASRHPGTNLSFALAATETTLGPFDDGDGAMLTVPVGNFTNASQFGPTVNRSFAMPGDIDTVDNPLQTGEITAVYGAFTGQAGSSPAVAGGPVHWAAGATHVVVWLGAAAPVDSNFSEDICPLAGYLYGCGSGNGTMPTCEVPENFSGGPVPSCEGWVSSQNGNPYDSIAALAYTGAACLNSSAGHCIVDSVVANVTPSDPASAGWAPKNSTGYTLSDVRNDTGHVVAAGCDMALATGGSWDGPRNSSCGNSSGTLGYTGNVSNPELFRALSNISLGTPNGAVATPEPGTPMFRFVTTPAFGAAPSLDPSVACSSSGAPVPGCTATPTVVRTNGSTILTWNWSSSPTDVAMEYGDSWSASFDLVATQGASNRSALDVAASGLGTGNDPFSGTVFAVGGNGVALAESFPVLNLSIEAPAILSGTFVDPLAAADAAAAIAFGITAAGGDPPYTVAWQFGDTQVANASGRLNVTHTFVAPGLYRVQAELSDSAGTTVRLTHWIAVFPALHASVTPTDATGAAPLFVSFTALPSGGDGPYAVDWDFGNGTNVAGSTASFTFATPGSDTVQVAVSDATGRTVNLTIPIAVGPSATSAAPPPLSVNGSAAYLGNSGCGVSTATVLFSSRAMGGVAPYTYHWNFGDGSFGVGPSVNHTYANLPGHWSAALVVSDTAGAFAYTNVTSASGPVPVDRSCPAAEIGAAISPMDLTIGSVGLMGGAALALVVLWRRE